MKIGWPICFPAVWECWSNRFPFETWKNTKRHERHAKILKFQIGCPLYEINSRAMFQNILVGMKQDQSAIIAQFTERDSINRTCNNPQVLEDVGDEALDFVNPSCKSRNSCAVSFNLFLMGVFLKRK